MTGYTEVFDSFAKLLTYPTDEFGATLLRLKDSLRALQDIPSAALSRIEAFEEATGNLSISELEELYTRTFDINPVSSLEVGWHLHGETYERGAFLVTMRDVLRRCSVEESSELPDHLSHVLEATGRMDPLEASSFITANVLKAVDKMLEGFANESNPYENVLRAAKEVLSHYAMSYAGV